MTNDPDQIEQLMRYLDGTCSQSEEQTVIELLKEDASARQLLSDLCEQAVSVADLGRTQAITQPEETTALKVPRDTDIISLFFFHRTSGKLATVIGLAALILLSGIWLKGMFGATDPKPLLTLSGSSSACQILTRFGQLDTQLESGRSILPGETVESQSSDSFLKLKLGKRSDITMAGSAYLRQMEQADNVPRFNFPYGSLWAKIEQEADFKSIKIQTSSATFEFQNAQFDLQTKRGYTRLRMNEGEAKVFRLVDQAKLTIGKAQMIEITSLADQPLHAMDQPKPVFNWQFHQLKGPDVILGEMRTSLVPGFAEIQAVSLPWKIAPKKYIMLYAAAFSVSRSSPNPVMLQPGAKIRYHFSYDKKIPVRFGFSTQRMRGVFAGKYETDVPPEKMEINGDMHRVELSLDLFRPFDENQSASPEGLEINDIYALTIQEDAGLRIHWIEILPSEL